LTAAPLAAALDHVIDTAQYEFLMTHRSALVVGVLRDGERATRGWGTRDPGHDDSVPDADAHFEIGSVTKVFTATLLSELSARDTVPLNEANIVSTSLAMRLPRGFTLQALATHTSGLPRLPLNALPHVLRNFDDPYGAYLEPELLRDLRRCAPWLGFRKHRVRYSNYGYAVLGLTLSRHRHLPFTQLLQRHVMDPLRLDDTRMADSDCATSLVRPRDEAGNGVPAWQTGAFAPAGGLRSTVNDLLRFLEAQLNAAPDSAIAGTQRPLEPIDAHDAVGLGWNMYVRRDGSTLHWHNGATGGSRAFLAFARATNSAVAILSAGLDDTRDGAIDIDNLGARLLRSIEDGREGKRTP